MIEIDYGPIKQFPKNEAYCVNESVAGPQVTEALKWLNYPSSKYSDRLGGMSPEEGFDCSGFVSFILAKTGVEVPPEIRRTNEYFDKFGILVHFGLHRPGDLIFFSKKGQAPKHMGIVLNKHQFIHSPGMNERFVKIDNIKISPINSDLQNLIYNTNPIGFKRFAIPDGRFQKF